MQIFIIKVQIYFVINFFFKSHASALLIIVEFTAFVALGLRVGLTSDVYRQEGILVSTIFDKTASIPATTILQVEVGLKVSHLALAFNPENN